MKIFIILATVLSLHAQLLLSPFDAMSINYGEGIEIKRKNILLTNDIAKQVSQLAKVKLSTKIYRIFSATKDDNLIGYGILVTQKVRSKDVAILSLITPDGKLKAIEVIAFNEPPEFIPTKSWIEVFKGKILNENLTLGRDIPTITGSTLSASSATKAARIALSIYEIKLKK